MRRFTALGLLAGLLTAAAASAADLAKGELTDKPADGPQVKRDTPEPETAHGSRGEKGDRARGAEELVRRIAKGMRRSEERLGGKDPREATQQLQRDIVKDIDE